MSDWLKHVMSYKKKHNCSLKTAMQEAKKTYVKTPKK